MIYAKFNKHATRNQKVESVEQRNQGWSAKNKNGGSNVRGERAQTGQSAREGERACAAYQTVRERGESVGSESARDMARECVRRRER